MSTNPEPPDTGQLPMLPTSPLLPTTTVAPDSTDRTGAAAVGPSPDRPRLTFYDAVGGEETFRRLVHRFYEGVAEDAELRPMYPEEDLGPAEDRLRMFLVQYWGGPRDYTEARGHPRLRMRHVPFTITPYMRDRWLAHMQVAVEELALDEPYATLLWDYLVNAAHSLVNAFEEP